MLRLMWQASRDGKTRVPLKKRGNGQFRDIPVPLFTWNLVKNLPDGPLMPGKSTRYMPYATIQGRFTKASKGVASLRLRPVRPPAWRLGEPGMSRKLPALTRPVKLTRLSMRPHRGRFTAWRWISKRPLRKRPSEKRLLTPESARPWPRARPRRNNRPCWLWKLS